MSELQTRISLKSVKSMFEKITTDIWDSTDINHERKRDNP